MDLLRRYFTMKYGILAQVVEHLTFNQVVGGSNPPCLINKIPKLPRRIGIFVLSGYGGIGRRAGFRFQWATVQVQVLSPAVVFKAFHETS